MQAADAVVTISKDMRDEIIGRGIPAERVSVVPNAVDDSFLEDPPDPSGLRHALGIEPGEVVIGVVTTMNSYEGLDVLVESVAEARRLGSPVRLLAVGDGPMRRSLVDLAKARDLDRIAIFPGQVPFKDVRRYHAAIDVFCVPRLDLPVTRLVTPLKPLEAMAAGRPVIASDLPPLREIVRPGATGDLVPAGDSEALAETIRGLVDDAELRSQLGRQAMRWVAAHRTWSTAAKEYRDLYQEFEKVTT